MSGYLCRVTGGAGRLFDTWRYMPPTFRCLRSTRKISKGFNFQSLDFLVKVRAQYNRKESGKCRKMLLMILLEAKDPLGVLPAAMMYSKPRSRPPAQLQLQQRMYRLIL